MPSLSASNLAALTVVELKAACKERGIKGYSKLKREELVQAIVAIGKTPSPTPSAETAAAPAPAPEPKPAKEAPPDPPQRQEVICGDVLKVLATLPDNSCQIVIADPPYNIGKDFGNQSDKQAMPEYLAWCKQWMQECLRVLRPNGTMFIYGFSEILARVQCQLPDDVNVRWLIWHYTNKTVPSARFWQRSHESILAVWGSERVFHRDDVREPYTPTFLNNAAGKVRKGTAGRFSGSGKETTYTAHSGGALPRDVIKIPALAGGAGKVERVDHPTQKPLALCERLLRSCRQPNTNGYVFVPFGGSGSECLAAKKLKMSFVCAELNQTYVDLTNRRLAELDVQEGSEQEGEVASVEVV
jgi:site-specific DNA-methyltransferase (adenine-specific)